MLRVNGESIENCPQGVGLAGLLKGELHSAALAFIKTPLNVYSGSIDGLLEYARQVKRYDSSYDTLDVFSEYDEETEEREFIKTIEI